MKVLVLGGTGMAGHVISIYLHEIGYHVEALSRSKIDYVDYIIEDVTNFERLKQIIINGEYDAVINCVGLLNEDAETNKTKAILINSYLPVYLSEITDQLKTKVVHLSTDCVFSGADGNYTEKALPDGRTFYDRSKALGELDNDKDLTFRNSIIGPDTKKDGIGLLNWFMKNHNEVNGYNQAFWTGVTTITLAKAIDTALKENLSGLYHLVNNEIISKYELLKLFNRIMREDTVNINSFDNERVDKSLINTRTDFSFDVPSYEHMTKEMKEWILNHKELYPHYLI